MELPSQVMGDVVRILMLCAILAAATLPAAAFDGPTQTTGGKKSAKPAAGKPAADKPAAENDNSAAADEKSKTAAMVQQALDAGIKAYGAGKSDEALRAFDAALRGGLPSTQMARLLYYRGLTYRKEGKPGLAISDLTSAVWLKNGLSEAERQDAIKMRAVAYHEAGISDVPAVPQSAFPDAPAIPSSAPAPGWQTAMSDGKTPPTAVPVSNAPAAPTPPSSGGGVGGFFSSITNMFSSSSSSAPKADESPVTTSSIDNTPPPPAPPPPVEAASWTGTTEVAAAAPPPPAPAPQAVSSFETKVAAAEPPSAPAARAPSGKYRLQVAAVRSRQDADAMAARVLEQHGPQLGGRQPEVDEAVIGSMGTFYRVRLGPYANAKEPGQLCGALRADGFDCLVVTQ
jgi:tetratricopeptide (TPR) repeat protein